MSEAELKLIPVDLLEDHPKNPRVCYRQDVIDGIVAGLNGEWPKKHALSVRPVGDNYQVVAGHHRKQAAIVKGIDNVWCWVESMDDDKAFMELATANNQGELDPIEIGIHAFEAVEKSQGKKGAGVAEYASGLGRAKQTISEYRNAGEVVVTCTLERTSLLEKAKQLNAIHKLPKLLWQPCVEFLIEKQLSVVDAKEAVKRVRDSEIPNAAFLPEIECLVSIFKGEYRQSNFVRLFDLSLDVLDSLADHPDLQKRWNHWLLENKGGDAWNIRKVQDKRIELEDEKWERENKETELETVNLIVADPPWQYDHAKQNRAIENKYPTATADEIATHLDYPWVPPIAEDCVLFMWTTAPKLKEAFTVLEGWGFTYKTHAIWDKERLGMGYWFRSRHELLLVATRGNPPTPKEGDRLASVFQIKRDNKHSKKPDEIYSAIESMFPSAVKFEMYAREVRPGWVSGGNESGS